MQEQAEGGCAGEGGRSVCAANTIELWLPPGFHTWQNESSPRKKAAKADSVIVQ